MKTHDWQHVKDLFAEAVELPPDERLGFLKIKCGNNEELLAELNSLLASADEPDQLIESSAYDLASNVGARKIDHTDQHFGNYRIIREIGSGGMGTVFLATRDDGEFTMQVALKIVRQSVADRDVIERFKTERQILADLNHPNIAALHDGGVSEKGEPFLAMEYVDGLSLIDYAASKNLDLDARLRLLMKVCTAVSFAHRNLVVHRDIKPSNILVNSDGEPKLLDFGLAKAFGADSSNTQTAVRAFTPAYASPEQIQGRPITTASDIYSLGVVLYELLTGNKPFNFENQSFDEIVLSINEFEPLKPSTAQISTKVTQRPSQLRGDLDNIVLMALRKEPERRYKTVDDLSDDIEKFLDGRPVLARPNTAGYVAGKFVRRNKAAVAASVVVLLALVLGFAASLWQADKANRERDRAEKRFQDVRNLSNSLLFEISPKIERLPGSIEARELLVQRGLEYLDSLASESQSDESLRSELASTYEKIGDLQGNTDRPNLNDFAGAISSLDKARTIRNQLGPDTENQLRLAQNLRVSSSIRNRQGDVSGALADADAAKLIFSQLVESQSNSPDIRIAALEAEVEQGQIFASNNQYSEAIPFFRNALAGLNALGQSNRNVRMLVAKCHIYLGNALSWDGQQEEAEREVEAALALSSDLEREAPDDSPIRYSLWQSYNLASSVYEDSNPSKSLDLALAASRLAEKALAQDQYDLQAKYNVARSASRVGLLHAIEGNSGLAAKSLERSEKIFSELIKQEPKNTAYQRDLGKLYVRMGDASEKRSDLPDALLKYQNSAVIFEKIAAVDELNTLAKRDLAQSLRSVGKMQVALDQKQSARTTLERARSLLNLLIEKNSLGGYDKQLIDDVEKLLASI